MFSVPITIPLRLPDRVDRLASSVDIDQIVMVTPLDNMVNFDVECNELYGYSPLSELLLIDGRKLPVCEPPEAIHRYLDAYRQIEEFYTIPISVEPDPEPEAERGVVIPLFPVRRPCVSSEGSTPV